MAEFFNSCKAELQCVWPIITYIWLFARRFYLNIPMLLIMVIIWIVEGVSMMRAEISLTKRLIKLESRYAALTKEIKEWSLRKAL